MNVGLWCTERSTTRFGGKVRRVPESREETRVLAAPELPLLLTFVLGAVGAPEFGMSTKG